MKIVREKRRNH